MSGNVKFKIGFVSVQITSKLFMFLAFYSEIITEYEC